MAKRSIRKPWGIGMILAAALVAQSASVAHRHSGCPIEALGHDVLVRFAISFPRALRSMRESNSRTRANCPSAAWMPDDAVSA